MSYFLFRGRKGIRPINRAFLAFRGSVAELLEGRRLLSASSYQAVGFTVGAMAADPQRNLVYLVDTSDNRILEVDTNLGQTVAWAPYTGTALNIAVATEDDRLFLTTSTFNAIQEFSLPSLTPAGSITVGFNPDQIAAGVGHHLFAVGSAGSGAFSEVDENTGKTLWTFGNQEIYDELIKTSVDGTNLYAMLRGLSGPGTDLYRYNINTSGRPRLTGQFPVPEANGEDFAVDEANNRVFTMNGGVYSVEVLNTVTNQVNNWPDGGSYGAAVAVQPASNYVFGASFFNITQFNRSDGSVVMNYPVQGGDLHSAGLAMTANGNAIYLSNSDVGFIGGSTLNVDNVPLATFTATQAGSATFNFNASGSVPFHSNQSISTYAWSFGDGSAATGIAPSHTFAGPGTYNVQLTVTASNGLTNTFPLAVHVTDVLEAHAGGPYIAAVGQAITLNANASIGNITSYLWDLNYNQTSFNPTASGATVTMAASQTVGTRYVALEVSDGVNTRFDYTTVQTLVINSPPTFTPGPNVSVPEDSGPATISAWATNISPGPADESGLTLSADIASDSNPNLFSSARR